MENSKEIIKSDGDEEGVDNKLFNPFTAHLGDCNESSLDFKGPDAVWQLKGYGIEDGDILQLHSAGLVTIRAIAFVPKKKLLEVTGLSDKTVDDIKIAASKLVPMGFCTAGYFLQQRQATIKITTGSKSLDTTLGGGIECGSITEIYGESGSGKTQFCLSLAVTCQLPLDVKGGNGKCLFIETQGDFRPERLTEICKRYDYLSGVKVLDGIVYSRAMNSDHQSNLLVDACALMMDDKFSLLIVDSATSLYRSDYSGMGELVSRQQHLGRFMRLLQRLADEFGVAVVVTNQIVANVKSSSSIGRTTNFSPVGGNTMAHASTTRLRISKQEGEERIIRVMASPCLAEAESSFIINEIGVCDK